MKRIINILLVILLLSACGTMHDSKQNNTDNVDNNETVENLEAITPEEPETAYLLNEITSYYPDGSKADYSHATYEYDEKGRLSKLTREDDRFYGSEQTLTFDTNGNKISETSPQVTDVMIYEYDSQNRLVKEVRGNRFTEYVYEENTVTVRDHFGSSDEIIAEYVCDTNGNVVSETHGEIEVTYSYEYDDKGRIISKTENSFWGPVTEKWIYNDNDNLIKYEWNTSVTDAIDYSYDDKGRLARETHAHNGATEYSMSCEYDDNNNLVKMSVYAPSGELTGYAEYTYITADVLKSEQTYSNEIIIKEFGIMPPYPYDGP